MSSIKTEQQIQIMRSGGKTLASILEDLVSVSRPGVTGDQLDERALYLMKVKNIRPAFLNYQGFPASICLSINEEILHGIPFGKTLKIDDLVKIDIGLIHQGLYLDMATSFMVKGEKGEAETEEKIHFLQVGQKALNEAIKQAIDGNQVGDISATIQKTIEASGFNVIREYTGHGVGEKLHESPSIPCFGQREKGEKLEAGQTLAIEVMYVAKDPNLSILPDGWTVAAKNGQMTGMFEHTCLVGKEKAEILTL